MVTTTQRATEAVARLSYGRLIALLARRTRDLMAAEDALAEAFTSALRTWPERGVPDSPEAWLLTAARRHLGHGARAASVRRAGEETVRLLQEELAEQGHGDDIPDERLKLLFVCAHPAIDPAARTPLMLQTVLGLDAQRIASAFLVSPAAMSQRLVRAKARIRDSGIAFEVPSAQDLPARQDDVLAAIYAAYGTGWEVAGGEEAGGVGQVDVGLTEEAIWLGRVVVQLLPHTPEALGLLALMLYCESRRDARRDEQGRFVPLAAQDTARWSRTLIREAESLLQFAARVGQPGRFQCEAAIQSVHCGRVRGRAPQWPVLEELYDALLTHSPTVGVQVSRAAVILESRGADAALAALKGLPKKPVETYQPYWVTLAYALRAAGRDEPAREALHRAIGLTEDAAVRAWLTGVLENG